MYNQAYSILLVAEEANDLHMLLACLCIWSEKGKKKVKLYGI